MPRSILFLVASVLQGDNMLKLLIAGISMLILPSCFEPSAPVTGDKSASFPSTARKSAPIASSKSAPAKTYVIESTLGTMISVECGDFCYTTILTPDLKKVTFWGGGDLLLASPDADPRASDIKPQYLNAQLRVLYHQDCIFHEHMAPEASCERALILDSVKAVKTP
jgi:hypothetical protein